MKKILPAFAFLAILISSFQTFAQTNVSGNLTVNTTWTKAGSPYILTGNVGIPGLYKLTIEPGVTVRRNGNHQILVLGALVANGTASDSITFASGSGIGRHSNNIYNEDMPEDAPFIEFQKTVLSNSGLRFVTFQSEAGYNFDLRVGNESEFTETNPKNSGILTIARSNLSKGMFATKGYNTTASLNIDSSLFVSAVLYGYYPRAEKIKVTNSKIYSSLLTSSGYHDGIDLTDCYMRTSSVTTGCCGAGVNFYNSKVEESSYAGQAYSVSTISNSEFLNSPLRSEGKFNISNSKFTATKQLKRLSGYTGSELVYDLIETGSGRITGCRFSDLSNTQVTGIKVTLYAEPYSITISGNVFNNVYNGVSLHSFTSGSIDNNDFYTTTRYFIENNTLKDIPAANNFFRLPTDKTVDDMIYDSADDLKVGTVNLDPMVASTHGTRTVSAPLNVYRAGQSSGVLVSWGKSTDQRIKNYKVYWGYAGLTQYKNSRTVSTADMSFLISGATVTDSIAVTALDAAATGQDDQLAGHESLYIRARHTAPAIISFEPMTATKNDTVTIHGTNLYDVNYIMFGGRQVDNFIIVSPTVIKAVVPARAGIDITVFGREGKSKMPGFTYKIPPPEIVYFRKTMATDGQEVLIDGYDLEYATAVSFGGVPAASFRNNGGAIYATVGAGATGDITVTTPSGVATAPGFYYAAKPAITSITPATATHGQNVRIKGVGFSFVTRIFFGDQPAEDFRQVTETEMEARVPEQAGNVITLDAFAGRATSSAFTYIHLRPTVTSITPKAARTDEEVIIKGADLWRVSAVSFGGVPAKSFMVISGNTIKAVIGNGLSGDVLLTSPEGTATLPGFVHLQVPVITSVSSLAGKVGSTVNITGIYLDSVKRVIFGDVDAASFKINSPTSITAVIGNGGTGSIRAFNNNGDGKYAGFVFVPVPVITGPVTGRVIAGGEVKLTTREAASVEYNWYRNGVLIPGAHYPYYIATLDGEYTVTLSKGEISETSRPFDLKVELRAYNDIKVAATGVTCKGANNGAIKITIDPTWGLTYSATVTGPSGTFTNDVKTNLDVPNLKGGTYEVCVKYVPQNYQKCFTIIVNEPKDLALYSTINKTNNSVDLVLTGADNYKIDVNGVKYTSTTGNITLALGKGNNDISVSSDLACQGILQKRIRVSDDITAYPNPFSTSLTLDLGTKVIGQAKVQIFNSFGKQVYSQQFNGRSGLVTLDLSALSPTQVYVLQLSADGDEFINKIIKK